MLRAGSSDHLNLLIQNKSVLGIKLLSALSPHVATDFHKTMKCANVVNFVSGQTLVRELPKRLF